MSANDIALKLVALKAAEGRVRDLRAEVEADLLSEVRRGTVHAALGDVEVGTVTITHPAPAFRVTDDAAFLSWCRENAPHAIEERVRDIDKRAILAAAKGSGEVPDGVDLVEGGAPQVRVRVTPEQVETLQAVHGLPALLSGE